MTTRELALKKVLLSAVSQVEAIQANEFGKFRGLFKFNEGALI